MPLLDGVFFNGVLCNVVTQNWILSDIRFAWKEATVEGTIVVKETDAYQVFGDVNHGWTPWVSAIENVNN